MITTKTDVKNAVLNKKRKSLGKNRDIMWIEDAIQLISKIYLPYRNESIGIDISLNFFQRKKLEYNIDNERQKRKRS